ncbi:MAG: hypothetical protein U7123_25805 [Potamolinea sp.]
MSNQQPPQPLFDAYDAYLVKIQNFFISEKKSFEQAIQKQKPARNDNNYENIIIKADQQAIKKIDEAIQSVSRLRQQLATERDKKKGDAHRGLPSKNRKS